MLRKLCSMTAVSRGASERPGMLSSEKGFTLVLVLVLSAVALAFMTALIYMITSGSKVSGLQKRYKTALDAGEGGGNVVYQLIATRGDEALKTALSASINTVGLGLNYSASTPAACQGIVSGQTYTGLSAKLLTPSSEWTNCNMSLNIDPNDPSTYDMRIQFGTNANYNVFAKIVAATDGNTGRDTGLLTDGVVAASGDIKMQPLSFIYAIEVVSENSAKIDERAKLSILYEY